MKYMSLIQESVKATGELSIQLIGFDGQVKQDLLIPNLVVNTGKNYIAARMKETGRPNEMSHMAVGTTSTAAAVGDTTLGAEIASSRVALTTAGGTVANNIVTYNATFPPGTGTGAITEAGIFNGASANTMLCRTVFAVVNKGADDTMSITWTVTIS
jgi:hypothetical protein